MIDRLQNAMANIGGVLLMFGGFLLAGVAIVVGLSVWVSLVAVEVAASLFFYGFPFAMIANIFFEWVQLEPWQYGVGLAGWFLIMVILEVRK